LQEVEEPVGVERGRGAEAVERTPHHLGARVVEDLAHGVPGVEGRVGQAAVEEEADLVAGAAEGVEEVLQDGRAAYVEKVDGQSSRSSRRTAASAVSPNSMPPPSGR
jgi:hypothetical protein